MDAPNARGVGVGPCGETFCGMCCTLPKGHQGAHCDESMPLATADFHRWFGVGEEPAPEESVRRSSLPAYIAPGTPLLYRGQTLCTVVDSHYITFRSWPVTGASAVLTVCRADGTTFRAERHLLDWEPKS